MGSRAVRPKEGPANEVAGLVLFALAALLLLSQLSYSPFEVSFVKEPPNPTTNWVGPVGLHAAWVGFMGCGASAYLLPVLAAVGGALAFWTRGFGLIRFLVLGLVMVLAAAGLADWADGVLGGWAEAKELESPGGVVGEGLNRMLLGRFLGPVGAPLVLLTVYFTALILLLRIRPLKMIREAGPWIISTIYRWRMARADAQKRLELQRKQLEREKRQLEKQLKKVGAGVGEGEGAGRPAPRTEAPEEPPIRRVPRPEPKIIDAAGVPADQSAPAMKRAEAESPKVSKPERKRPVGAKAKGDEVVAPQPAPSYEKYQLPPISLLERSDPSKRVAATADELAAKQDVLVQTLGQFGITVEKGDITRGATITRYELYPAPGVRVDRILSLDRDIARAMKAESINILAPVPGKDSVAVDLPNASKVPISLRDLLETGAWSESEARVPLALGKDVYGAPLVPDLSEMPHMLIGGSTGSGKSVCINCMLMSLLMKFNPADLRIILVDPKVVELQVYNGLPHLIVPVVTDPKKVLVALRWVINEMEKRYDLMAKVGVRNIMAFNRRPKADPVIEQLDLPEKLAKTDDEEDGEAPAPLPEPAEVPDRLPYIVIVIDELADLMQTAPKDVELAIARLSAKARAAGIHLILATQTPRAQVVTGVIKTNIPCRVSFKVPSALDSRVILDDGGAENLLGKGDMLFLPPGSPKLVRAQGAFVSDEEVHRVVEYIRKQCPAAYEEAVHEKMRSATSESQEDEEDEELVAQCIEVVRQEGKASTSLLQRRLRLGYTRAARIMDVLERRGIVGPENGAKPREVLIGPD
ncbi:MAG: DNA translocase FtsK 4TM domain-containing protein [Verrucomicrobiae bacterium]|nr:DNA translocase FtsK 4TM domain-containing protein [Verrucomicrobiae bacterium]